MEVKKTGTIISVEYKDQGVKFTANRIRGDSGSCEVLITWNIPFEDGTIRSFSLQEHTKLMDSWAKEKLIKTLEDRSSEYGQEDMFNWGTLINDGFMAIVTKHREGNAPEYMLDMTNSTPRSYAIKPLFVNGVANLMWARGGSSKSYFALMFCVLIDKGMKAFGLSGKQGKALYLDWEEDSDVFKQRLRAVQVGLGVHDPNTSGVVYKKMIGSLANNIEEISRIVLKDNITFIVIDSVSPALGGDSNSQEVVEEYFGALRELNVTSVSIDHANKAGEVTGKFEIHGSSFKYARARMVYELKKKQESNDNSVEVFWYHRKSNDSRMRGARGFKITFNEKEEYNEKEQEYETTLTEVGFEELRLGDADNQLLRGLPMIDLVHALVQKYGQLGSEELISQISAIKEIELQKNILENAVIKSNRLSLVNGAVSLKQDIEKEEEWTI